MNSVKAYLYDRAVSPLFGAFCFAWVACNYRTLMIILSGESLLNKFELIDKLLAMQDFPLVIIDHTLSGHLMAWLIQPLLLSVAIICLYPLISVPVYAFSLQVQRQRNKIKKRYHDGELLTVEQSRELYRKLSEANSTHAAEVSSFSERENELRRENEMLLKRLKKFDNEGSDSSSGVARADALDKISSKLQYLESGRKFRPSTLLSQQELNQIGIDRFVAAKLVVDAVDDFDNILSVPGTAANNSEPFYIALPPDLLEVFESVKGKELLRRFIGSGTDGVIAEEGTLDGPKASDIELVMFEKLEKANFCMGRFDGGGNHWYSLTSFGREFLVDFESLIKN